MRLRNIPGAEEAILNSEYCIKNPEEQKVMLYRILKSGKVNGSSVLQKNNRFI